MAETTTQTTLLPDLAPEFKEYYHKTLLKTFNPKLVYNQFGEKFPLPQGHGTTIEWRRFSKLPKALTPLTEGITPVGNNLQVTAIKGTVKQYGDWIRYSDLIKLAALDPIVIQGTKALGSQAGRTVDTVTREEVCGGTNVMYAPAIAEDGTETEVLTRATLTKASKMTVDLILRAAAHLDAYDVEDVEDGDGFVLIVHPYVAYDIRRDPEWKHWQQHQSGSALYKREVGRIGKVRVVETSESKVITGDGCPSGLAVFECMMIGAQAYGVTELEGAGLEHIIKPLGYGDDPLNQRASVGWKCTHGAKRLNEEAMVRIECCSTYSALAQAN